MYFVLKCSRTSNLFILRVRVTPSQRLSPHETVMMPAMGIGTFGYGTPTGGGGEVWNDTVMRFVNTLQFFFHFGDFDES